MSLTHAPAPALSACEDPAPGAGRRRWAFWRSPAGQPPWARPALLGIAALAALLYAWNITRAGLAPFYSVAVKSMSESWKAFFYGAFDPKATITIDKLAGSFLPQALSARIFGFHPWSLALPQVIEGVVSVLVMYRVVRRWAGVVPGLLAAGIFALTPIAASMFGHSMEDGALTMCLVLAADAWQRAVMDARLRSLVWAGVWVGLGFQAKMLQAWIILPALAFGLIWRGRAGRTDRVRGGLIMWGTWLLTFGLVYSEMSNIPHTAYMASLAPPIAALSGAGIVLFWRWYRSGDPRWWVLPLAVAAELGWAAHLWSGYPAFLPWVRQAAIAVGVAVIVVLVVARLSRRARFVTTGLVTAGLAAAVAAMLAAPATWASSVLDARYAGSSFDASAGPAGGFGFGTGPGGPGAGNGQGPGGGILATATTTLSQGDQQLYDYLSAHRDGAGYLMAAQSWSVAAPFILATGQEVMPMGGFSGSVPEPTLARVRQLAGSGQLRFFLLGGAGFGPGGLGGGAGGPSQVEQIISWVEDTCSVVPAQAYGATTGTTGTAGTLYECRTSA